MSEQVGMGAGVPEDNHPQEGQAFAGMSAGDILRLAREEAGVHIAALAVALKVPVSKIDALETGRYDEFPDNVFMRALAASVCRTLKVDPAPVLALLPSGAPQALNVSRGLNASFRDPGGRFKAEGSLERPNKSRWVGAAVVALLIGALAVAFFPHKGVSTDTSGPASAGNTVTEPSGNTSSAEPREAPAVAETAASVPVAAAAVTAPAAPASAAVQAASVPVAAASASTDDPSKILEIRAREASWIKIVSATNGVVLQRELAPGESVVAAGSPPWNVTVGRPDATDVIVRGQPMSMSSYARGAVARFEVK